jgi:hypothetical protein
MGRLLLKMIARIGVDGVICFAIAKNRPYERM